MIKGNTAAVILRTIWAIIRIIMEENIQTNIPVMAVMNAKMPKVSFDPINSYIILVMYQLSEGETICQKN